jgi:hypothetical protein
MRRRLTCGIASIWLDQPLQLAIRYRQRIATRQDHFADRVIAANVVEGLRPVRARRLSGGVGEVAAETVAAVDAAMAGDDQQHASVVLVDQPRHLVGFGLCQRVAAKAGLRPRSAISGSTCLSSGSSGVCRLHARDEGTRHAQGESLTTSMASACGERPSSASSSSLSLITVCSAPCQGSACASSPCHGRASRYHGALHFIDVSRGMQWRAILPTNSNRA